MANLLTIIKYALIPIYVFISEVAANPSLHIIAEQISNSLSSNMTTIARVAVSKMSSTPSPVRQKHSGYFRDPTSWEIAAASVVVMTFRDLFAFPLLLMDLHANFCLAQQV